jgi:SRSO17 transposase
MEASVVRGWEQRFEQLIDRVGPVFARRDLRRQAGGYVRGLLGRVERKNSWQLAEHLGQAKPFGIQRLLSRSSWDAQRLGEELVRYAADHLIEGKDSGVLIVDETGFLKKGVKSVGVQRQYSGTAGRIENCQIGVFLALSTSKGRALIDRELYLPESWCEDKTRREQAGVPQDITFCTKPQLAMKMLGRSLEAGLAPAFVLADEVYGSDGKFRRFLEDQGQAYVVAVSWVGLEQKRVDQIQPTIPAKAWLRLSVADGAKGPRVYDWAATPFGEKTEKGLQRWLLIRRNIQTKELAYYFCAAPDGTTARDLAIAAGKRWAIEVCFESSKQETGLDEYEVRSWTGWYRHVTLSMLASVFLTAVRIAASESKSGRSKSRRN